MVYVVILSEISHPKCEKIAKILNKYPQYQSQIEEGQGIMGMAGQAIGDTLKEDLP